MITPLLKRLQRARTTLLLDQPFFGVLALRLTLIEDPNCQTAWTNGQVIAFSPTFAATLSNDELIGVLAHEVMHCACGHMWRRNAREPKKWNVAADYAINSIIVEAGLKLPDTALLDAQYTGRAAEWIFDRLPDQDPNSGNDPGGCGGVSDAPAAGTAGTDDSLSETDWQQATRQAAEIAKGQGKLPASLARELDRMLQPKADWRSLLRRFISEIVQADYSWSKPNPRHMPRGFFLPSLHSHACGRLAVAVDTSGSIDDVLLSQFAAEIQAIASEVRPSSIDVIYCDAAVNKVDHFDRDDSIVLHAVGGGGTDFRPVFDHLETDDPPVALIYLTDLCGSFPTAAPDYPVLWAVYGGVDSAPFGEVVPCE